MYYANLYTFYDLSTLILTTVLLKIYLFCVIYINYLHVNQLMSLYFFIEKNELVTMKPQPSADICLLRQVFDSEFYS